MNGLTVRAGTIRIDPTTPLVELDLGFGPNGYGVAEAARLVYGAPRRAEIHGYGTRLSGALVDLLRRSVGDRLLGVVTPVRSLNRELSAASEGLLRERAIIESFSVGLMDGRVRIGLRLERTGRLEIVRLGNSLQAIPPDPTASRAVFASGRTFAPAIDRERLERIESVFRRELPAISNAMSQVRLFVPQRLQAR